MGRKLRKVAVATGLFMLMSGFLAVVSVPEDAAGEAKIWDTRLRTCL